jgi:hypothetical protein
MSSRADERWAASVADQEAWLTAERAAIAAAYRELAPELRSATKERDRAERELERLRRRSAVRLGITVDRNIGRGRRLVGTTLRRVGRPAAANAPTVGNPRPEPGPSNPTPGAFRSAFLDQLERRSLRCIVLAGAEGDLDSTATEPSSRQRAAAMRRALAAAGWPVVETTADADVAVLLGPDAKPRVVGRGPVLVAWAGAVDDWPKPEVIDDADVAIAIDDGVADRLRPLVSITTSVARPAGAGTAGPAAAGPRNASGPGEALDVEAGRLALALPEALRQWAVGTRVGIAIGPPNWDVATAWGDLPFSRGLQRAFERRGVAARVHILPEWTDAVSARDDIAIHLFGLRERRPHAGQRTILWVISHPDRVSDGMLAEADRAYVGSDLAVDQFGSRTTTPVSALHQATDPAVFRVDPTGPAHAILFVGNTRGVRRQMIDWINPTSLDLAIYGQGWSEAVVGSGVIRGEHVPNAELHRWYGAAGVVLNDHWPDMRDAGFLSNRLYDVLAAGGFVISDWVAGIDEEFDGAVVTARSPSELRWAVRDHLADPTRRRRLAERGHRAVLERHTFSHRIDTILADLALDTGSAPALSRPTAGASGPT